MTFAESHAHPEPIVIRDRCSSIYRVVTELSRVRMWDTVMGKQDIPLEIES